MKYKLTKINSAFLTHENHEGFGPMDLKDFQRQYKSLEAAGSDKEIKIIYCDATQLPGYYARGGYAIAYLNRMHDLVWTHANEWFTKKINLIKENSENL